MADSGVEDTARIVIFGCRTDFHRLVQCSTWVVDGTFKSAPELWYQIWVIHGMFRGRVMPFVYALLPNKQQCTYERALERILSGIDDVRPGWRPTTLVIDFEKAEMNAFERLIPGIATHGCYFHFNQSIWRQIQNLGLSGFYLENAEFRSSLKCFAALAFLPVQDVQNAFNAIANGLIEDFQDGDEGEMTGAITNFLDYFEKNWVGRQRINPRFPVRMWNCHDITLEGLPRTSNSAESWHHAFASIFNSHHPNPYKLVEGLLREQVRVDFTCTRLEAGEQVEQFSRIEYKQANERLLALIGENRNGGDFLRACTFYIHYGG
uniref:MULE transposase domain-containing protein n=1 Tax=Globodera rostochiensis TaxID=31243 RepID=A0A914I467_GLORO